MEPNAHRSLVKELTTAPSANRGGLESSHRCIHQKDRPASLEAGRLPSFPKMGCGSQVGMNFRTEYTKYTRGVLMCVLGFPPCCF